MKSSFIPFFNANRCIDVSCNLERHVQRGSYEVSVLLSDEDCKVVGLNVSGDKPNIISISSNELSGFSKAKSDCKKKTIHLVMSATKAHPYFELKSTGKNSHLTLGDKKVKVSPDWLM